MSEPEEPVEPMSQAIQLSRLRTERKARSEALSEMTGETTDLILALSQLIRENPNHVITGDDLTKAIVHHINRQYEYIFPDEIKHIRTFIRYLGGLGVSVSSDSHRLTELEAKLSQMMKRAREGEADRNIAPTLQEFSDAKSELIALSQKVDERALDALAIIAKTVDREAADRLFHLLTDDL
jgi:hypothetical protein